MSIHTLDAMQYELNVAYKLNEKTTDDGNYREEQLKIKRGEIMIHTTNNLDNRNMPYKNGRQMEKK